jgi:hypothetical protein
MLAELYVEALFTDPVLAVMVMIALEDGVIDLAAADLAWLAMAVSAIRSKAACQVI